MGYLINAWNETQKKFTMSLKQIVNIAGDESLENEDAIKELRDFFGMIDLPTMERLMIESYSKEKKLKFESRGFAFQDLINEMGIRLGYDVTHGLYRGKKGENGFDGLWKLSDGTHIIMEAKVTGDYAFSPETIIGYRDRLIGETGLSRKKCSILVVYGRDEKGTLRNSVKGSDDSSIIRLISANALFQLVKTITMDKTSSVSHQIYSLLKPKEYFVLDNLVELVFPETDSLIDAVDDEENNPSEDDSKPYNTTQKDDILSPVESTNKSITTSQSVLIPPLPNSAMKIGAFVYTAMQNLANSGFEFSAEDVAALCEEKSMKKIIGMQRSLPFFKLYDPNDEKGSYINDRPRYYNHPLKFGSVTVYINSQIYKTDREPFITWYESLGNKYKQEVKAKPTKSIPPLPDRSMKVGSFIRIAMENLAKAGFTFSEEEISDMCSENWMHDKIGMSRKIPFLKQYDPNDPKGNCINGTARYYSNPLVFENCTVYLTKELFAADKEPFILWYEGLKDK